MDGENEKDELLVHNPLHAQFDPIADLLDLANWMQQDEKRIDANILNTLRMPRDKVTPEARARIAAQYNLKRWPSRSLTCIDNLERLGKLSREEADIFRIKIASGKIRRIVDVPELIVPRQRKDKHLFQLKKNMKKKCV